MMTKLPHLTPELYLLFACCRAALPQPAEQRQQQGAQIQQWLAPATVDWSAFLRLVEQHGVQPLVYQSCQQFLQDWMPPHVYQQLKSAQIARVAMAFQQLLEVDRLVKHCRQQHLQVVSLKGVVLAQRLYDDITRRTSCDIDLLVGLEQLAPAEQILLANGYQCTYPGFALTPKQERAFRAIIHHSHYRHPDRQVLIELHWRPYAQGLLPPGYTTTLLGRTQTVTVEGKRLPCLADGDLLLYLCLHGAKHHWSCLKWVCDIAALLQAAPAIDWTQWQKAVEQLKVQSIVGEALLLAQACFGVLLPPAVAPLLQAAGGIATVAARYANFYADYQPDLLAGGRFNPVKLRYMLTQLTLSSARLEWWHTLRRWWLTPQDWRDFPLPDALFPLYYLLRPCLWLWRHHWPRWIRGQAL